MMYSHTQSQRRKETLELLRANINNILWWNRRIDDGLVTRQNASQFIEESLRAIHICKQLL